MSRRNFISVLIAMFALLSNPFGILRAVATKNARFIGNGVALGKNRAIRAANQALSNTLSNDLKLSNVSRATVKITGSKDLSLYDVEEASSVVYSNSHSDVDMKFVAIIDNRLRHKMQVNVVGE